MRPFLVCLASAVIACGSSSPTAQAKQQEVDCILRGTTVTPPSATLHAGDTLRAKATSSSCGGATATYQVRWSVSDTSIVTVDTTGLVLARKQGTATVIAKSTQDPSVSGAMVAVVVP